MNDFRDDFVPYEQALQLKELGFDEPCFAIHSFIDNEVNFMYVNNFHTNDDVNELSATAPLYQQAFKFFRDKYKLYGFVYQYINHDNVNVYDSEPLLYNGKFVYGIERMAKNNTTISENDVLGFNFKSEHYNSCEEAELACLNKLIEICKKQK